MNTQTKLQPDLDLTSASIEFQNALIDFTLNEADKDATTARFIDASKQLNSIIARSAQSSGHGAANSNEPLPLVNPAEWQDKPVPPRSWYLEPLIPSRQVTILAGDGGVGKSLFKLQIAAASALQCETLGLRPSPGRVMYLGAEDEAEEFHRRLADIVYAHQRQLSDLADFRLLPLADADALLSIPDRVGVMQPTALWHQFAQAARDYRPVLIVLDTAADLYGGDEIKRAQVRQFISMLRKLAIELDCAVVLLAHPSLDGMRSGTGSSGSTAWNNSVRSRLYLTSVEGDADARLLTTKKANYGKVGGEIKMRWCAGAFVLDDGKPSSATGLLNQQAEKIFVDVLSKLNRQGQKLSPSPSATYAPKIIAAHPDAKGQSKKALTEALQRLLDADTIRIVEEGSPSRRYRRLLVSAEIYGEKAA